MINKAWLLKRSKLTLILIVLLASVLRFYRLDSYPALNADEAAIGYNAYSLIKTGLDEHGNSWPIHFQSFNDYKPGFYFYIVLPFVRLLGLNEWSVRIPGAFLGVLTVVVIYLLVKELFKNEKLALISSLFLAISPWHIHFSRGGWEVNVATFFVTLGVWLFIHALKNPKFYFLSVLSFVLSMCTYHAARVVIPLLGLGLVVIYFKEIFQNTKYVLIAGLMGIVLLVPLARDLIGGGALTRVAGVGLFADLGPRSRVNEQRGEHGNPNDKFGVAIHNKAVNYSLAFLENWGKHYWGEFLFLSGDEVQRNKVPETGEMYLTDIVFLSLGVIVIIKTFKKKEHAIIVWWLIVAPVASALTFQAPGALRAHNMVIPLVIISAFGSLFLVGLIKKVFKNRVFVKVCYAVLAGVVVWNFTRYLHMYWVHTAKEYPFSSQYGLKDLVGFVKANQDRYQKIIVTDRYDQPYVLFLFYLNYSPSKFQREHQLTPRDQFGFSTVNHFNKYYFTAIRFDEAKKDNPNSLIAGTDEEVPNAADIIKVIYGPNGQPVFKIVAN